MAAKWWSKLLGKKAPPPKVDVLADIDAVIDFLGDVSHDVKELLVQLKKLKELEKEYHVAASGILHVNLETQARVFDQLLERYEFFENDVDVNGLRVKMMAKEFLKRASKAGMTDLVRRKERDKRWLMLW